MIDPVRDGLIKELRALRREPGLPTIERLSGKYELVEALGMGDVERAWESLERLREAYGDDRSSDIGAYFYLAGWGIGLDTLDQRIRRYAEESFCVERTGLRRGDRGAEKLADIIRSQSETAQPWGLITIFQSGAKMDAVVRLMLGEESWRPATVRVNDIDVSDPSFTVHRNPDVEGGRFHQHIVQDIPLDLDAAKFGNMASVFVHWPMPIWPTWQFATYVADPRMIARVRTLRGRAVEVWLEWSRDTPPTQCGPLVTDQRIWTETTDPHVEWVPEGWRVTRR